MLEIRKEDAIHKIWLLRLLIEVADNDYLAGNLIFKGGTCASLLSYLDRFSVDLDFDLKDRGNKEKIRKELKTIAKDLDLTLKAESKKNLFFVLKYKSESETRNTIHLGINDLIYKNDVYKTRFLPEIGRSLYCQTIETMFSHKLAAVMDRYGKYKKIAGRDLYDLYYFFIKGYSFDNQVLEERTGEKVKTYLQKLISFIQEKVSQQNINQDLSTLLPLEKFQKIRKGLKNELLMLLEAAI